MRKIYFLAAAALALAACSNDDNYIDEPIEAHISATIGESAVSRATDNSWAADDSIGVTMAPRYANLKYTTKSGDGKFAGTAMYFKNKAESVNLTAYYPFTGTQGTAPSIIETNTGSDNQTSANQPKIDFLYAVKDNVSGTDPNVTFDFSHKMSKLSLKFINGTGAEGIVIESYKIGGLILKGSFNPATGQCAAANAAAEPLDITLADREQSSSLILFPQKVEDKKLTLSITDSDGQYYACTLSLKDNELASGNDYQFSITVNKTGLTVNQSSINDWTSTTPSSGNASSVVDPDK